MSICYLSIFRRTSKKLNIICYQRRVLDFAIFLDELLRCKCHVVPDTCACIIILYRQVSLPHGGADVIFEIALNA